MAKNFGLHLTLDLKHCNKNKLKDSSFVYDFLSKFPGIIGMHKITLPYVVKWLDKFSKGTEGISGFVMIAESHISVHTFPDQDYAFVDIFSCVNFNTGKCSKNIVSAFEAKKSTEKVVKRGLDFTRT